MRVEYSFTLDQVTTPRFAVEAVEGIGKLFTLATLVLNVLDVKERVDIVFHGLSPDDPERKIHAFQGILSSSSDLPAYSFELGEGGSIPGSSTCFQWVHIRHE